MDYDAIVIGSGFGGAITSCRLAQAGYRVLILERGRRWSHKETDPNFFPRAMDDPSRWVWDHRRPERSHGWVDLRLYPHMAVAQGAGVGGGSLIYANISVEAPPSAFEPHPGLAPWPKEVSYGELKPYYDRVASVMKVRPVPPDQWSARTRLMRQGAEAIGQGHRFRTVDLAVTFCDDLKLDPKTPLTRDEVRFAVNEYGVEQGTCYHCGTCDLGCDVNARNTLDTNYLPMAEAKGAEIRPLHLVEGIEAITNGYRVRFDRIEAGKRIRGGSQTARIVILAAGSLGSTELLLRCRDEARTLPGLSPRLGQGWSSNGDFLTPAFYPDRDVSPSASDGPTITSVIDFLDRSQDGQSFWIQDGGFPDLMAQFLDKAGGRTPKGLGVWMIFDALRQLHREHGYSRRVMPWFAQSVDAGDGVLGLRRPWWFFGRRRLWLSWDVRRSKPAIDAVVAMHERLAEATGGRPLVPWSWSVLGDLITPHPLGGCGLGDTPELGVVSHSGEVFGRRNLFVADGAILPRAIGVNPSRTISALAERIAEILVEEGR